MRAAYLGPAFPEAMVAEYLRESGYPHVRLDDEDWPRRLAQLIVDGKVVGLFQGRMEYGPRALGSRSILGDARSPRMQSIMNLKIKYRESFRPFAPSCLEESIQDFFDLDRPSPYMLLVADVLPDRRLEAAAADNAEDLRQRVNQPRSDLPAITHVDYSARVQSVSQRDSPRYHALLKAVEDLTGVGIVINTSFNVRGEPIVCTPEDAYRCFMRTDMDYLALGPFLLEKSEQEPYDESKKGDWRSEFPLD